jgi:excisionase family DNA binding protein
MERLAYRVPEAAAVLGISRTKAYALIAARQLPVIRMGKSMRVPAEGLRDWVRRQTRPTSQALAIGR